MIPSIAQQLEACHRQMIREQAARMPVRTNTRYDGKETIRSVTLDMVRENPEVPRGGIYEAVLKHRPGVTRKVVNSALQHLLTIGAIVTVGEGFLVPSE